MMCTHVYRLKKKNSNRTTFYFLVLYAVDICIAYIINRHPFTINRILFIGRSAVGSRVNEKERETNSYWIR